MEVIKYETGRNAGSISVLRTLNTMAPGDTWAVQEGQVDLSYVHTACWRLSRMSACPPTVPSPSSRRRSSVAPSKSRARRNDGHETRSQSPGTLHRQGDGAAPRREPSHHHPVEEGAPAGAAHQGRTLPGEGHRCSVDEQMNMAGMVTSRLYNHKKYKAFLSFFPSVAGGSTPPPAAPADAGYTKTL